MSKKKKYYAYFVPKGPSGVTDNWNECEKIVSGRAGARYRAFEDVFNAERWLKEGARYEPKPTVPKQKLQPGIYFDAGTGRGKGVEISVTDEKGKNLLHKALSRESLNRFGKSRIDDTATNNYGELLALKYALEIAEKEEIKNVFGDSKLVIDYWSQWRIKRKELSEETVRLSDEVSEMREQFEFNGGTVEQISGDVNPADLGFHR